MAIKKKENNGPQIPAKLDKMLFTAFSFQQLKDQFDKEFKAEKGRVVEYLDNNSDGFDVNISEGFKSEYGTVIYSSRANNEVNTDKLEALIASGAVSLHDLLEAAKISATNLEKILSSVQYKEVVKELDPTLSLTFRATSEFKDECQGKFQSIIDSGLKVAEAVEVEVKKPAAEVSAKVEKAKAASKKASKSKNASDDLADILGEK